MNTRFRTGMVFGLLMSLSVMLGHAAPGVVKAGKLKDNSITESSGLAASKRFSGILWTHNDSGNNPVLFAVNRQGNTVAKFKVTGPKIDDWEDIAVDNAGNIYIADTGNNNGNRDTLSVHLVKEPAPKGSGVAKVQKTWKLKVPGSRVVNAEALFISNGYGYLIGKDLENGAPLYRFPLSASGTVVLQRIGSLKVNYRVTGACLSADGTALGVISENGAYLFTINGNPLRALSSRPVFVPYDDTTMEGCTFTGDGFLVSSEQENLILFNQPAFRKR